MNKSLIIILIIFVLIIFFNKKKNKLNEKMNNIEKNKCDYSNAINIGRAKECKNDNCNCYFKQVIDSDLELNILNPVLKKLNLFQIDVNDKNKFFNYRNLNTSVPSYLDNNNNLTDNTDFNKYLKITRTPFDPDITVSRVFYNLHNDLFLRYYLSKINSKLTNQKIQKFLEEVLKSSFKKINKLFYDKKEADNKYEIEPIFIYDKVSLEKKNFTEIKNKLDKKIINFNIDHSINDFIKLLKDNNKKLVILYQNNFMSELQNELTKETKNYDRLFDYMTFFISEDERILNYLAKCTNNKLPDQKQISDLYLSKINSSEEQIRNCSVLAVNDKLYKEDIRQVLINNTIRNIYENVYGLTHIPNLNISFQNYKKADSKITNISGEQIKIKFDELIKETDQNIKPIQTALSYFGLCENIELNNKSRKKSKETVIKNLEEKILNKISKESLKNYNQEKNNNKKLKKLLENSKNILKVIENKEESKDDVVLIGELINKLENNDYSEYYLALAVSDKIKYFTNSEIENRKNSSENQSYKLDFNKKNRFNNLGYYPEADLIESKKEYIEDYLKNFNDNGELSKVYKIDETNKKCLNFEFKNVNERPDLNSLFKCQIKEFTSIGISNDPYLAMNLAIENCKPNASILFLNKSRYINVPNMNKHKAEKLCPQYKSDKQFDYKCQDANNQNNNDTCHIIKFMAKNSKNKMRPFIGQGKKNSKIENNLNKIVSNQYVKCQKYSDKLNKKVNKKCEKNYRLTYNVDIEKKDNNYFMTLNNSEITPYFKIMVNDKLNKGESVNAKINENSKIIINKIEGNVLDDTAIQYKIELKNDVNIQNSNILTLNETLERLNRIDKCKKDNKYQCYLHSVDNLTNNISDFKKQDDNNKIPVLTEKVKEATEILNEEYGDYKCLTDCYKVNGNEYFNKMKATGLKISSHIESSKGEKNYTNKSYQCENISVEDYLWERNGENYSKQNELILNEFEKNGKAKIINKFRKKCNSDNDTFKKCESKLNSKDSECFFYYPDKKLKDFEKINLEESKQKKILDICDSTIKGINYTCNRDKNNNYPEICDETIVLGVNNNSKKCYAFHDSNKCYLDNLNGKKYDYMNINNLN